MTSRALTLRLDQAMADDLATVAAVDGKPVVEVIRCAIAEHVTARRADPRFRTALREHIARVRRLLGDEAA